MNILVTGGTGYIGSHTAVELIEAGHDVTIIDDLSNSSAIVIDRIETITGVRPPFYRADVCDADQLRGVFRSAGGDGFDAVMHFAGWKAVGESVEKPLTYYQNNIAGTLTLCAVMNEFGCRNIIFSSSATVYGDPAEIPITEKLSEGCVHESVRMDEMDDRTDSDGFSYG